MTLRVTVEDLQTGDVQVGEVAEGDYLLICHDPCRLDYVVKSDNDSRHVLTVAGRLKSAKSRVVTP